jgi:hypothetical protein
MPGDVTTAEQKTVPAGAAKGVRSFARLSRSARAAAVRTSHRARSVTIVSRSLSTSSPGSTGKNHVSYLDHLPSGDATSAWRRSRRADASTAHTRAGAGVLPGTYGTGHLCQRAVISHQEDRIAHGSDATHSSRATAGASVKLGACCLPETGLPPTSTYGGTRQLASVRAVVRNSDRGPREPLWRAHRGQWLGRSRRS